MWNRDLFATLDPGSGMETFGSGSTLNIQDPQHCGLACRRRCVHVLFECIYSLNDKSAMVFFTKVNQVYTVFIL